MSYSQDHVSRSRVAANRVNCIKAIGAAFLVAAAIACCAALPAWADEGLAIGVQSGAQVSAQANEPQTYSFENDTVQVKDVSAGTVSYDPSSKTLTLNNVTMSRIYVWGCPALTVNLVGTNKLGPDEYGNMSTTFFDDEGWYEDSCNLTIKGSGSAVGAIYCGGSLTMIGGSLSATAQDYSEAVSCGSLTLSGGSIAAKGLHAVGAVSVKAGSFTCDGRVSCRDLTVAAGSFTCDGDVGCDDLTMATGKIAGDVGCGNITLSGGSIAGDVSCGNITLSGGSIASSGKVYASGAVTVRGGSFSSKGISGDSFYNNSLGDLTVTAGSFTCDGDVSCGNITMATGKIAGHVSCGNLTLSGGSIAAKGGLDADGAVTVKGGSLSASAAVGESHAIHCKRLSVVGGTFKSSGDVSCSGFNMRKGTIVGGVQCDSFAMSGGSISKSKGDSAVRCNGNFAMSGGTIVARNTETGIVVSKSDAYKTLTMKVTGGTIKCIAPSNDGLSLRSTNLRMSGGTIAVSKSYGGGITLQSAKYRGKTYGGTVAIAGGKISSNDLQCDGGFTIKGGTVSSPVSCDGAFTMKKGAVRGNVSSGGSFTMANGSVTGRINSGGSFTMKKGTVKATNPSTGISAQGSVTIRGGVVKISKPSNEGIDAHSGNVVISGGTVVVAGSYGSGIRAVSETVRGRTIGGRVSIIGGKVSVTVRKPSENSAVSATTMTNKIACLKTIKGSLPSGAKFKVGGNEYRLGAKWGRSAVLAKYGAKSAKPVFSTVKYGGYTYSMRGIGSKAFNTAQGKKVQSITFKDTVDALGADAFLGTSSLTSLKFEWLPWNQTIKNGKFVSLKWWKEATIDKQAFRKCGKSNGAGLTVVIGDRGVYKDDAAKYQRALMAKGLPKAATIKTYK